MADEPDFLQFNNLACETAGGKVSTHLADTYEFNQVTVIIVALLSVGFSELKVKIYSFKKCDT